MKLKILNQKVKLLENSLYKEHAIGDLELRGKEAQLYL